MKLGPADKSGRPAPIPVKGSEFTVDADTIIPAIGQAPDLELLKGLGLKLSQSERLLVDENSMNTNIEGIFAGGDIVTGPLSVVDAMASGRKAACSIDSYLKGEPAGSCEADKKVPEKLTQAEITTLKKKFPSRNRVAMPELPSKERVKDFKEVEQGFSIAQAREETERCMTTCIFCEICRIVCPAQAITLNGKDQHAK
jgi:NADPH-dependent glutamate synthase beta subunit-like oxidoreductase